MSIWKFKLSRVTAPTALCLLVAVFTYGDRGYKVVAVFLAAAAGVHLAELNRARSASQAGGRSTQGSSRRYV